VKPKRVIERPVIGVLLMALVSVAGLSGCSSAPQATLGAKVPDAVTATGDVERFDLAKVAHVEGDVSAGAAYTLNFTKVLGTLTVAPKTLEASTLELTIDTTSAESSWQLVADVAKEEFLHTVEFPEARFVSRALRKRAVGGFMLFGDLTLLGKTVSVSVPMTIDLVKCTVTAKTEFAINRRKFGAISPGGLDAVVSDDVVIRISAVLPRKREGCPAGSAP